MFETLCVLQVLIFIFTFKKLYLMRKLDNVLFTISKMRMELMSFLRKNFETVDRQTFDEVSNLLNLLDSVEMKYD